MSEIKRVAFIGAGGINSWSIKFFKEITELFFSNVVFVTHIYDADEVEEKNILQQNQNFTADDLLDKKAKVLADRYEFISNEVFIDSNNIDNLKDIDIVVMGVDNHKTRKLVYEYCLNNNIYLLDLRAQGRLMSFIIVNRQKGMEYYNNKYFNNPEVMERKGSCQFQKDIENNHIENANKAIAFIGMYCVLVSKLRNEEVSTDEYKFVY